MNQYIYILKSQLNGNVSANTCILYFNAQNIITLAFYLLNVAKCALPWFLKSYSDFQNNPVEIFRHQNCNRELYFYPYSIDNTCKTCAVMVIFPGSNFKSHCAGESRGGGG